MVDVGHWVSIGEYGLIIGINSLGVPESKLTQTIGGTIAEHIYDTTGTYTFTTGTDIATIRELRIVVQRQVFGELNYKLCIQICTANT